MIWVGLIWLVWMAYWQWMPPPEPKAYRIVITLGNSLVVMGLLVSPEYYLNPGLMVGIAAGLALTVWARRHLGQNWSPSVFPVFGVKEVTTGPYWLLRDPIYYGYQSSVVFTSFVIWHYLAFMGAFLVVIGFEMKIWIEQEYLRRELRGRP